MAELIRTPVFQNRLLQAPVLHLAVINVIIRRDEGEIRQLVEGMVTVDEEAGLINAVCDWLAISEPCDVDHRWEDVVHKADKGVGLTQQHRGLGEHSRLRSLCKGNGLDMSGWWSSVLPGEGALLPRLVYMMATEPDCPLCLELMCTTSTFSLCPSL